MTQRLWDMRPEALHAFRELIDKNLSSHIPLAMEHEKLLKPYMLSSRDRFRDQIYVGTARYIEWYEDLRDDDQIINVISINGPITRNGGACSYGSKEIRNFLKEAADMDRVIGHIIVIDSPGGSSKSRNDFEQAIDYVRNVKKQPVIALVDGMACSAGYLLASLCNEIYVVNPKDEVGSIGTMAAFNYTPDGAQDEQTKSIFVERYAEGSPYKNKWIRDLFNGDDSTLMNELNQASDEFKQLLTEWRPQVTDEQKLGECYLAKNVMGTLVDGVGTMQSCIDRILELSGNGALAGEEENMQQSDDDEEDNRPDDDEDDNKKDDNQTLTLNDNQQEMSKSYEKIQSACGAGALESDKNGLYLQTIYCEKLEAHLAEAEQKVETLDAKMREIAGLNETIEKLKSEQAAALEALKAEYETKLAEATGQLKEANDKLAETESKVAEVKQQMEAQLKEANDKLADKENELNEMAAAASCSPKPEAPKSDAVNDGRQKASPLVCSASKSAEENRKALKERMEQLRRQRNG